MAVTFELQVLGCNSATPLANRFPSSFVLNHDSELYLIDCGEGAQIKMSEFSTRRSKINHVFISHLHGDHVFGLPGFLNSLSLNNRKAKLTIIGPVGIKKYVETVFELTQAHSSFPIEFHELGIPSFQNVFELPHLEIFAFPLKHRIPTFGYLFKERQLQLNLRAEAIQEYGLTIAEIKRAKLGEDISRVGQSTIPNMELVLPKQQLRSFAYCSDTIYDPSIVPYIQGANLIYHEATYLHELSEQARARMHATTKEAALIAAQAGVGKLIIGHYSSRYRNLEPLLTEAKETFANTHLAVEGKIFSID